MSCLLWLLLLGAAHPKQQKKAWPRSLLATFKMCRGVTRSCYACMCAPAVFLCAQQYICRRPAVARVWLRVRPPVGTRAHPQRNTPNRGGEKRKKRTQKSKKNNPPQSTHSSSAVVGGGGCGGRVPFVVALCGFRCAVLPGLPVLKKTWCMSPARFPQLCPSCCVCASKRERNTADAFGVPDSACCVVGPCLLWCLPCVVWCSAHTHRKKQSQTTQDDDVDDVCRATLVAAICVWGPGTAGRGCVVGGAQHPKQRPLFPLGRATLCPS